MLSIAEFGLRIAERLLLGKFGIRNVIDCGIRIADRGTGELEVQGAEGFFEGGFGIWNS
jgi:hypothetical protein